MARILERVCTHCFLSTVYSLSVHLKSNTQCFAMIEELPSSKHDLLGMHNMRYFPEVFFAVMKLRTHWHIS